MCGHGKHLERRFNRHLCTHCGIRITPGVVDGYRLDFCSDPGGSERIREGNPSPGVNLGPGNHRIDQCPDLLYLDHNRVPRFQVDRRFPCETDTAWRPRRNHITG